MGTDCKSAAFSFGGSNPPAPTKKTSVEIRWSFSFAKTPRHTPAGGFEQLRPGACVPPGKKPRRGFFSSAACRNTRAHQKDQRRKYAGLFLLQKTKDTPSRVDSNSCGPALCVPPGKKPRRGFFSSAARRTACAHQKDQRIKNGSARKLNRKAVSFQANRGVLSGKKQKSTKKFKKRLTFPAAVV